MCYGCPHMLVRRRWAGRVAATRPVTVKRGSRRLERLTNCEAAAALAAVEQATGRALPRPAPPPPATAATAPPQLPPTGFTQLH
jgi:hypothetical protein